MANPQTLTLCHLRYDAGTGCIVDAAGRAFDEAAYSRMKHGVRSVTRRFARTLAEALLAEAPQVVLHADPPLFLAAYKAVPPACHFIGLYCLEAINLRRVAEGKAPGRLIQVYKDTVVAGNYALQTPAARQGELEGIGFSLEGRSLCGRRLVLLDDARITGAAERRMLEIVRPEAPSALALGYVLAFDEACGKAHPEIENRMNHAAIREIGDLLPAIRAEDFELNIRVLKLALSTPLDKLEDFLRAVPVWLCSAIVRGAAATGVEFVRQHAQAYALAHAIHLQREACEP
ncbi:MAG: phosphoribosyltransferase family protein [Zoogloeaceae bacterium]|jgi:hypothetical protein|nr:phosphoribosyltransferase family protein [Zoogloeaceae bacterium]